MFNWVLNTPLVTVVKQAFRKNPPKEIYYRNYKQFIKQTFKNEPNSGLNGNIDTYSNLTLTRYLLSGSS